jgi:hypothetical protein
MSDMHPILGASNITNSQLPIAGHAVPAIVSRTAPIAPKEIAPEEVTRYYCCKVANHHMIRFDGKKLAFVHGILATRDVNDIVYLDGEIANRNLFLREATVEEVRRYEMAIDPIGTIKKQISPQLEADLQEKLSAHLALAMDAANLTEDQKKLLATVVAPATPVVDDLSKLSGIDKQTSGPTIKTSGATITPVPTDIQSMQASIVGSNKTVNAAPSNKT